MRASRCTGSQTKGIVRTILHEIDEMILGYDFGSWEHYRALMFFREQLERKLKK